MHPGKATSIARTNIALVKYWGKRNSALNLPAAGSLSLTLDGLSTKTTVEIAGSAVDRLFLNGQDTKGEPLARVTRFLDLIRARAGISHAAVVTSDNSFPTASGLASSASAFAALAVAACRAYGLGPDTRELSALARRGSGSAARSIFGGLVEMLPGKKDDGSDAHAVQVLDERAWDLRLVVGIVHGGAPKQVSSRSGMDHTAETSPYYQAWLSSVPKDLEAARKAIVARDLTALGEIAEQSALTMHASALAARPGILYFRGPTVEAILAMHALRRNGTQAFVTIDAGPHVKVLCAPEDEARVTAALSSVAGITSVIPCRPGAGVELLP
ncbi:MAG: diphosphomevalonate decarboxylase [Deltaproteobacteria bacterium]|nr:diphosphomevalonate decarboxylase [Deltaproteobacteria bacterium]